MGDALPGDNYEKHYVRNRKIRSESDTGQMELF